MGGWTGHDPIALLAVAPSDGTIYATTQVNSLYRSIDDGSSWTRLDRAPGDVAALLVDPRNSQTLYAAVAKFGIGGALNVFTSTNGGQSWRPISGNLPNVPAYSLAMDPRTVVGSPATLYLGTDQGVYAAPVGSNTWTRVVVGLPNVQVTDLQIDTTQNILAAGTYGRGMWEIGLTTPGVTF
jgi:hypothetical protein